MQKLTERAMRIIFLLAACVSIICAALICVFLFVNGLPAIAEIDPLKFLLGTHWKPSSEAFGIAPMIVGSIYVTAGALIVGTPLGILAAVYLARFCPKRLYKVLNPAISLMAGIPSIIYGFFGLVVLVPLMHRLFDALGFSGSGKGILTASILLGVMILPTIIRVSESAIRAVPQSYYEGALALGATAERSVFFSVLPAAKSGVLAGVVLGMGRAVGETMAVVMVAGNQAILPESITSGVRTLTANIVVEMGYASGLHRDALIATAAVLFVFILLINLLLSYVKNRGGNIGGKTLKLPWKKKISENAGKRLPSAAKAKISFERKRDVFSAAARAAVRAAIGITALVILLMVGYILIKGVPHLTPSLFAWKYNSDNVSLMPALINTLLMTAMSLLIAVPLGVFTAVYLVEYAKRGNKLVKVIRMAAETLAGIPSIVYGIFGMVLFVVALGWRYSLLAGGCTLAIMVLPVIMRTTEEALISVPDSYREGSFGLGAGKLRTVFRIVLPAAVPGILSGIILAVGRVVGETAALIFTAGTLAKIPHSPMDSARTLAVHMYNLSGEGLHIDQTYATAVVLIALVLLINALSSRAAKKLTLND